ncbi:N-acetylglucosamine kinase [Nocardiopsis sediminis]|uniref:N-acetylglucosamine kinase n=1 Tax=Nocardiopsis sediminis TaxID=1778267 RepID=A0ABV8FGG3_9ACTN
MTRHVVIGVDAGGTSTRCVVATLAGEVVGYGRAGGANRFSSSDPEASLTAALGQALAGAADITVDQAVFGLAGAASGRDRALDLAGRAWAAHGLPGQPHVTDDIAVAFASGSAAPSGSVLIAGTGAVAARVRDGAVERRCDGHGWLLGDEGSAVWIGVAGLRAVLATIDGRGPATALGARLAAALGAGPGDAGALVRAAHARPPADLGALAPEVTGAAAEGDPVARGIVADAAGRLLADLEAVAPDTGQGAGPGEPVVFAGALLAGGPVADAVRSGLHERRGAVPVQAVDGARGAAGLALRRAGGPAEAHAAVLAAKGPSLEGPPPERVG